MDIDVIPEWTGPIDASNAGGGMGGGSSDDEPVDDKTGYDDIDGFFAIGGAEDDCGGKLVASLCADAASDVDGGAIGGGKLDATD
mmetsp:Transcript_20960/g.49787  ORF Transcript_20960/g.49787 Transcript_20960/m.49787 type:complete len:85 (-) Transcript_20960:1142-1396(-)